MTKQEFINTLRISLNGKVSPAAVEENVSYYEDYINTQIRMGQSEQEVLASLGDPRLIAKSVMEASGKEQGGCEEYRAPSGKEETDGSRAFRVPVWVWIFLVVFVIFLILGVIFSIVWALLPILIPVALVLFIIQFVRRNQ